jgi:hypothetical protein
MTKLVNNNTNKLIIVLPLFTIRDFFLLVDSINVAKYGVINNDIYGVSVKKEKWIMEMYKIVSRVINFLFLYISSSSTYI